MTLWLCIPPSALCNPFHFTCPVFARRYDFQIKLPSKTKKKNIPYKPGETNQSIFLVWKTNNDLSSGTKVRVGENCQRDSNKLNPHMTSSLGIEPGPHWWKASAVPAPHFHTLNPQFTYIGWLTINFLHYVYDQDVFMNEIIHWISNSVYKHS